MKIISILIYPLAKIYFGGAKAPITYGFADRPTGIYNQIKLQNIIRN